MDENAARTDDPADRTRDYNALMDLIRAGRIQIRSTLRPSTADGLEHACADPATPMKVFRVAGRAPADATAAQHPQHS